MVAIVMMVSVLSSATGWAQQKLEREYYIKGSQVPGKALSFVKELFGDVKVTWYGEESLTGHTIEAKLRSQGKRYSVEFDSTGTLEDIEILAKFNDLPERTRSGLTKALNDTFRQQRVMKTQIQWKGNLSTIKMAIKNGEHPAPTTVQYELIIRGRKEGLRKYYEVQSDHEGSIQKVSEIIQPNASNLIY